ncbi:MAG: helix-turn-helix domain-containing protein [Firmicutes bacterium]|nr:helix-turn-helix domain-containing protein [Bacillota bacterium]
MFEGYDDKYIRDKIRQNLALAIKQSGISQTVIAKEAYISDASLSDYFHKGTLPSLCTFVRICKIIGVSADEILDIE